MYNILNTTQLLQAYPKFLMEWHTSQQLIQYIVQIMPMTEHAITSWTYEGLTDNLGYHVFSSPLPSDYGKFFYDILFDTIDGLTYPVSRMLPVNTPLQNPPLTRNGLWLSSAISRSYVKFCQDDLQSKVINDLLATLDFTISIWVYMNKDTIDVPILYNGDFDPNTGSFNSLFFALYPDKWVSSTKTTVFNKPSATDWHLYVISVQNDNVSIYIDGTLEVQDTGHSYDSDNLLATFVSTDKAEALNYFDGAVSEFVLWNQALADSDVSTLYIEGISSLQSKIVFLWPMYKTVTIDVTNASISVFTTNIINTSNMHTLPSVSDDITGPAMYIKPDISSIHGVTSVARIIDMNIPKTSLLWTCTDTKLLLYIPTNGIYFYQNVFWIPQTFSNISQYVFFNKLHNFTLWYWPNTVISF